MVHNPHVFTEEEALMCTKGSDKLKGTKSHGYSLRAGNYGGTPVCGFRAKRKAFTCLSEGGSGGKANYYCCNAFDVKSHMFLVSVHAWALCTRCLAHSQLLQTTFLAIVPEPPYQAPAI